MTAGIQAANGAVAASGQVYSVTVGAGVNSFGFASNGVGAMTPSTWRGHDIITLASDNANSEELRLLIGGSDVTQSFFSYIDVIDSSGARRKFASADATFVGGSQWTWSGTDYVWTDTTSPRTVTIY